MQLGTHLVLLIPDQQYHCRLWQVHCGHVAIKSAQTDAVLEGAVDEVPVVPHCGRQDVVGVRELHNRSVLVPTL